MCRMAEWVKKQAEREAEKEQRRLERLQRKLAEPRHTFTDPEYERQYREMAERQEESLRIGTAPASSVLSSASLASPQQQHLKKELVSFHAMKS